MAAGVSLVEGGVSPVSGSVVVSPVEAASPSAVVLDSDGTGVTGDVLSIAGRRMSTAVIASTAIVAIAAMGKGLAVRRSNHDERVGRVGWAARAMRASLRRARAAATAPSDGSNATCPWIEAALLSKGASSAASAGQRARISSTDSPCWRASRHWSSRISNDSSLFLISLQPSRPRSFSSAARCISLTAPSFLCMTAAVSLELSPPKKRSRTTSRCSGESRSMAL